MSVLCVPDDLITWDGFWVTLCWADSDLHQPPTPGASMFNFSPSNLLNTAQTCGVGLCHLHFNTQKILEQCREWLETLNSPARSDGCSTELSILISPLVRQHSAIGQRNSWEMIPAACHSGWGLYWTITDDWTAMVNVSVTTADYPNGIKMSSCFKQGI